MSLFGVEFFTTLCTLPLLFFYAGYRIGTHHLRATVRIEHLPLTPSMIFLTIIMITANLNAPYALFIAVYALAFVLGLYSVGAIVHYRAEHEDSKTRQHNHVKKFVRAGVYDTGIFGRYIYRMFHL